MRHKTNERLTQIERAAASSVGASVEDTVWLVRRIRELQDLLRESDRVLHLVGGQMRAAAKSVTDCRQSLERERA